MAARRLMTGLLCGTLLVSGAACGGSGSSSDKESGKAPKQIFNDASKAVVKAKSFHMDGTLNNATASGKVTVDVQKPDKVAGSVATKKGNVSIIAAGGAFYIKADAAFWQSQGGTSGAALAKAAANQWLKLPAGQGAGSLSDLSDPAKIFAQSFDTTSPLKKVAKKTVDGQSAVGVQDDKGSLLWVRVDNARPVELIAKTKSGDYHFSQWDADKAKIAVPAGAKDLTQLLGGG